MDAAARDLEKHLLALQRLRGDSGSTPGRLVELKHWQSERLRATYADLAAQPRYVEATDFFLGDLYGPRDFSRRDAAMLKVLPAMQRMLPASALATAALAIELEALSEDLDHRVAAALAPGPLDAAGYAAAYRVAGTPAERARQIDLIVAVGERLDALVKKPLILSTLKLMRRPARLAGFEELQDFLERGFEAFRAMGGAKLFLGTLREREEEIARRLFSGSPLPFAP